MTQTNENTTQANDTGTNGTSRKPDYIACMVSGANEKSVQLEEIGVAFNHSKGMNADLDVYPSDSVVIFIPREKAGKITISEKDLMLSDREPHFDVLNRGKFRWRQLGAAYAIAAVEGAFLAELKAVPVNGQLTLLEPKAKDEPVETSQAA